MKNYWCSSQIFLYIYPNGEFGLGCHHRSFRVKSYVIGLIHGLAGSAAIMLAILPTTPNLSTGILFLLFFSVGTIISMSIMTIIMSIPFVFTESNKFTSPIISIFGALSIGLGLALGSDIAMGTKFTEFLWY